MPIIRSAFVPYYYSEHLIKNPDGCLPLASGENLAAFALTEKEAGSDASNVQTTATPYGRRPHLSPQRHEALYHEWRDCRSLDGDGPHA